MDVVALAQHGVGNAVATLGTATTPNHIQKLLRQASRIVFCFDGDAAGRKAAWRALEASLEQLADDKVVGFLFLPAEHDPDSFVRAEGAAAFRALAAQPTTLAEFLMRELKAGCDLATAEGRAKLVFDAKPYLQRLAAPMLRVQLAKAVAEAAALAQAEVEAECGLKPLARGRRAPPPRTRAIEISQTRALLKAVLRRPERAARIPLDLVPREHPEGDALHAIADAVEHGELPGGSMGLVLEFFRGHAQEGAIVAAAGAIAAEEADEGEEEAVFADAVEKLHRDRLSARIDELTAKARSIGLTPDEQRLWAELLAQKSKSSIRAENQ